MTPKKRKKRRDESNADDVSYICPTCGEQIVIPVDITQGREQKYVEDCPICCHPNVIHVEWEADWKEPRIWAESE